VTWLVILAGILACWITSGLGRKQKWLGFGYAVVLVASPFVLLQSLKILAFIAYNPVSLPEWSGTIVGMFFTVIAGACLVALGWGGALAAGRFFGWVVKDLEALDGDTQLDSKGS
jgi:hypothetical protein